MLEITVRPDGKGGMTTVQAAVDAVPAGTPAVIRIGNGVYRERVVVNKDHLTLVGEDAEKTVITYSACAMDKDASGMEKGTFLSYTLLTAAQDVTLSSLTVRNDAGDGRVVGQAVALYAAGDRGVFRNVRLIACQDTLFLAPMMRRIGEEIHPRKPGTVPVVLSPADCGDTGARAYFENCLIRGDVDFIFGSLRSWFEKCEIVMNARGGWYTAPNTPEGQPYGFVFHDCRLTGECGQGRAFLGRPWRKHGAAVFLDCYMDDCVNPGGFADWDAARVVTPRMGEGLTRGPGAALSRRHPAERIWTREEAAALTVKEVLAGWDPGTADA